ncbi:hypothetical protein CXF72_11285 [Psychromonas sp. MB-3u-54]|uniref:hypothetical protein n=1 Tax=Psychromonas sp. MB-3u-54 TaxID=2058319 RepID=UPI000C3429E3|nr:hypothetical protein [Psychromonas sp. MB-3u-54]PKH02505.1 hypothetical protein CXF72_11285 [Psychromonas sp. MB-3u-54]
MQWHKIFSVAFLAFILSACGEGLDVTTDPAAKDTTANSSMAISVRLLTCPIGYTALTDCSETSTISSVKLGVVAVSLTQGDEGIANEIVTATTTIGALNVGTALTDENGLAIFNLTDNSVIGGGRITITTDAVEQETSGTLNFEIGASNLEMSIENDTAGTVLAQNSTALITVKLTVDAVSYNSPVEVTFTSYCAADGTANLDETVTSINGVAQSTYQPIGCVGDDLITASAQINSLSASTTVTVASSPADSIRFLNASPQNIAIKGTGGADRQETAKVLFQVVDQNGKASALQDVQFELGRGPLGTTINPKFATTNTDGEVYTVVSSGKVPGTVKVKVKLVNSALLISSLSSELSVSTGLPDQNSFSVSTENFSPEAFEYDGVKVGVTVQLADHYNNAVPDGTTVFFHTEAGAINDQANGTVGSCLTEGNSCSVNWVSGGERPTGNKLNNQGLLYGCADSKFYDFAPCITAYGMGQPYGGRVTITAYTTGEESFVDRNSDGEFTPGESFTDDNCDGTYTFNEPFVDSNSDGEFTKAEVFIDSDFNGFYTVKEKFKDIDGDGSYSPAEPFDDINGDGVYSKAELFTDTDGNNTYTAAEAYEDSNGDGEYTMLEPYVDSNDNKVFDGVAEDYVDSDGNDKYTAEETFTDSNNDGQYTSPESYTDTNDDKKFTPAEPYTDIGNGSYDSAETYTDTNDNGSYDIAEPYTDTDKNGSYDSAETYTDTNDNGSYDIAEAYIDAGNGKYDAGEPYTDTNGSNTYDIAETYTDANKDGGYSPGDAYQDSNNDGHFTLAEPYTDSDRNGSYTYAESFTDTNANGHHDMPESFTDSNKDGIYTATAEDFTDSNGDGLYTTKEEFTDSNGDGLYTTKESFTDLNGDGIYTSTAEVFDDTNNDSKYDYGETFTDIDGNGQYTVRDTFDDTSGDNKYTGDTFTDLPEVFYDNNEDGLFKTYKTCDDNSDVPKYLEDDPTVVGADKEESIDLNQDGYSFGNKLFNGMLCSENNAASVFCERELVNVSDNISLIMASGNQYMRIQNNGIDANHADLTTATGVSSVSLQVYVADINNNHPPTGSTISVATDNGELSGKVAWDVADSNSYGPFSFTVFLTREATANKKTVGITEITVTSPKGLTSTYSITVSDDG